MDIDLKWIKFQSVSGELNSPVQRLGGIDGGLVLMSNETSIDSATGNPIFFLERTGYTFKRNISAMRFSGELFSKLKFGLHYLKAKDDIGSVDLEIDNYGSFNVDSSAYAGLSMDMYTGNFTYDEFLQVAQDNNALVDLADTKWNYRDPSVNELPPPKNPGTAPD